MDNVDKLQYNILSVISLQVMHNSAAQNDIVMHESYLKLGFTDETVHSIPVRWSFTTDATFFGWNQHLLPHLRWFLSTCFYMTVSQRIIIKVEVNFCNTDRNLEDR